MKDFLDRTVLITGGSSGIGLALAKIFAVRGADVWIMARRQELLDAALVKIEESRANTSQIFGTICADVSNEVQVNQALDHLISHAGIPDLVINSAGITYSGYFQDIPTDAFRQNIDINYMGTVYVLKKIVPGMIDRGSGHIVNISSIAGFVGVFGYSAYAPSKYAISGLSETLLFELRYHGIKVSIVFPVDTDTPQLEEDKKLRPALIDHLSGSIGGLKSAEETAKSIVKGIERDKYVITTGFEATWMYYARHTLSTLAFKVIGAVIDSGYKKFNQKK